MQISVVVPDEIIPVLDRLAERDCRTRTLDPLIKSPTPRSELIMVFSQPGAKVALKFQSVARDFPTVRRFPR